MDPAPTDASGTPRVLAATLPCENCGRPTVHRILRWDPKSFPKGERSRGVARCRNCGWTHPFDMARATQVEVARIVSRRSTSIRDTVRLGAGAPVVIGSNLAGVDPPVRVRRIDLRSGGSAPRARAEEIATIWTVADEGLVVPVSIQEGARTRPTRWEVDPNLEVAVGDERTIDGVVLQVVALRARGHTWRRAGDRFRASELERVYGRRTEIPPAGRRDWSRGRGRPSSRTNSRSRSSRSRSGPGVKITRKVPRVRIADGGATHHRRSPS